MGREIAKCLRGPVQRHDGYLVTQDGVVTWLFGHILRQAEPEEYDARYKRWRAEDLPILPQEWKLYVAKDSAKQFGIVKGLIAKADEIVHAGDPDREGQLLVDEVLDYLGNKKPVQRILLNALDEKSIKSANAHLQPNEKFFNLKQSALARARATGSAEVRHAACEAVKECRTPQERIIAIRTLLAHRLRVAGPGLFELPFDIAFSAPDGCPRLGQ